MKNFILLVFVLFFAVHPPFLSNASDRNNGATIVEYARKVQAQLAAEAMNNDISIVRIGSITNLCGFSDSDKNKYRMSKKEISKFIINRIFELRDGDDNMALFLKERTQDEISILLSGTLSLIKMYQVGFRNSVEFNFDIGAIDKNKYCELINTAINNK